MSILSDVSLRTQYTIHMLSTNTISIQLIQSRRFRADNQCPVSSSRVTRRYGGMCRLSHQTGILWISNCSNGLLVEEIEWRVECLDRSPECWSSVGVSLTLVREDRVKDDIVALIYIVISNQPYEINDISPPNIDKVLTLFLGSWILCA